MVKVQYNGQLGNQLFQYTFGRLLAARLNQVFVADPIQEFKELNTVVGSTLMDVDRLIVNGYFENSHYYLDHSSEINSWFKPTERVDMCAIHIRGGDAYKEGFRCPPIDYYRQAIKKQNCNCKIFTDDKNNSVVKRLATEFGFEVESEIPIKDFQKIRSHKSIIIGNSTFAWWAAFLSGHNNIIQPLPEFGWRSKGTPSCLINYRWTQIGYEPNT